MRRVDRWLTGTQSQLLRHGTPLLIDLGFGASPATAIELHARVRQLNPRAEVLGLEISPERVQRASAFASDGLSFAVGGFELPAPRPPAAVRLFNVLRQYQEEDVPEIWAQLLDGVAPGGIVIDGTCDEIGRRAAWVTLRGSGPVSLTLSTQLASLGTPSDLAERLPKALIHRNVPGEKVHSFFQALDAAWAASSAVAPFGLRQRWRAMCAQMLRQGWPLIGGHERWRLGEITVAWEAVAPGRKD